MDIVLTTFNARYSHTALSLRCLRANLGDLRDRSVIIEFDNRLSPQAAAEKLLDLHPRILLFSVYIWNLTLVSETAAVLKTVRPDLKIVIGGPEVSYEYEELALFRLADHLICGEGEAVIEEVCRTLLGRRDARDTDPQQGRRDACDTLPVPQASRLPESSGFNPLQEIHQSRRKNLPHWTQEGCTYFVTFRLADSIAQSRIHEYKELREQWEEHHHPPYTERERAQFDNLFSEQVNDWLDGNAGACILRTLEISKIVADTLTHFDETRYDLDEWVIMPNHVHALVTPLPGFDLASILHSWKSYSAHEINKITGQTGSVWKKESYDHIVRDQEELTRIRNYIRDNPRKAKTSIHHCGSRRDARDTDLQQGRRDARDTLPVPQASRLPCLPPVPQASRLPCLPSVPQASRLPKVIHAPPADLGTVALPYGEYTDEDIAHRRIYVESSRGCPFSCEYCLSALEPSVRVIPPKRIFPLFSELMDRGARVFKFLDRSFNIKPAHAAAVLRFFLDHRREGMMLHLEWEPGHLPPVLHALLAGAPPRFFQIEAGVQTFNPEVAARIARTQNADRVEKNIRLLAALPSVHLHADLIAGLPGETFASIAAGFDRLHACGPHEIQLGILKKLRGALIARHDAEWQMVYNPSPPYDVLQTSTLSFAELQRIRRFARFWDITVNNGRFPLSAPLIWQGAPSVFAAFMAWSEWVYEETRTTFGFTPARLAQLLAEFLTAERSLDQETVRQALEADLHREAGTVRGLERQSRKKV